jgi:hypothetical protein
MRSFFDEETGVLSLDEQVAATPSFQRVLHDDIVTDDELEEHRQKVISLLIDLDEMLADDVKDKVRALLVEIAVLYAIERVYDTQALCADGMAVS